MHRLTAFLIYFCMVGASGFCAEGAPEDGAAAEGDAPAPQFKSAKGSDAFQKAKTLFEQEKYTDARAELKKVQDQTKTAADKPLLQTWVSACEGGMTLDGCRQAAAKGPARKTFFIALDAYERYRATPIAPRFKAFIDELRPKALEVLESFDLPSPRYSEKYGKRFEKDPAIVYQGPYCLQWSSVKEGKASQLKLTPMQISNWSRYHSLVFWVRCERPVELHLLILTPGKSKDQQRNALEYIYSPPAKSGWSRAEIDLDRFKKYGSGSLSNVEAFVFQIESNMSYKIYLDEVCLTRKDGGADGAAVADEGKDADKDKGKKKAKGKKAK